MKGDKQAIEHLNKVLANEITAISQYFLHYRLLKSWGMKAIAEAEYGESIDEMKHADTLIERILFLEGTPNLEQANKVQVGGDIKGVLEADLELERRAMPDLRAAVAHCEKTEDFVTREIFAAILKGEEEHADWLETQLELIEKMGLENYIQSQS